jgi:hypothetical protein
VVNGSSSTLQEEKMLSNQWVVVDGCRLMSMIDSMSNNNQKEAKEITMTELAQEMRRDSRRCKRSFLAWKTAYQE